MKWLSKVLVFTLADTQVPVVEVRLVRTSYISLDSDEGQRSALSARSYLLKQQHYFFTSGPTDGLLR